MDSAAGSGKSGRDRATQGILALRGKVLNTENATASKFLANAEIQTIIEALGTGTGHDYEEKDLKYDKLIIMTDADSDGGHIATLLLTFLYRHMPEFVKGGHVYQALAPLYKITDKANNKTYVWNKKDLDEELRTTFKGKEVVVSRFKGLGEMNPDELRETTMLRGKRKLKRLSVKDDIQTDKLFSTLMGKSAQKRKDWIEDVVELGLEEGD